MEFESAFGHRRSANTAAPSNALTDDSTPQSFGASAAPKPAALIRRRTLALLGQWWTHKKDEGRVRLEGCDAGRCKDVCAMWHGTRGRVKPAAARHVHVLG